MSDLRVVHEAAVECLQGVAAYAGALRTLSDIQRQCRHLDDAAMIAAIDRAGACHDLADGMFSCCRGISVLAELAFRDSGVVFTLQALFLTYPARTPLQIALEAFGGVAAVDVAFGGRRGTSYHQAVIEHAVDAVRTLQQTATRPDPLGAFPQVERAMFQAMLGRPYDSGGLIPAESQLCEWLVTIRQAPRVPPNPFIDDRFVCSMKGQMVKMLTPRETQSNPMDSWWVLQVALGDSIAKALAATTSDDYGRCLWGMKREWLAAQAASAATPNVGKVAASPPEAISLESRAIAFLSDKLTAGQPRPSWKDMQALLGISKARFGRLLKGNTALKRVWDSFKQDRPQHAATNRWRVKGKMQPLAPRNDELD